LALDRVGDVRFENNPWKLPDEEMLGFVRIPAGPFRMGEGKEEHEVTLPEYYLGRYPATVGQFRAYCETGKVRPQNPNALQGASNLPVAGVSWNEAVEYCKWLTEELQASERTPTGLRRMLNGEGGAKWRVTLPSEAEWEKAARGADGRKWPWGNEWDTGRANSVETGIMERTAVGCFYEGRSPYGLEEMSGNVWSGLGVSWANTQTRMIQKVGKQEKRLQATSPAWCAAARSSMDRGSCAARFAPAAVRSSAASASVSGWCCPHSSDL